MTENFNLDDLKTVGDAAEKEIEALTQAATPEEQTTNEESADTDNNGIVELNINDIAPKRAPKPDYTDGVMAALDEALDREKQKISERSAQYIEKEYQRQIEEKYAEEDAELNSSDDDAENVDLSSVKKEDGEEEVVKLFDKENTSDFLSDLDFDENDDIYNDDDIEDVADDDDKEQIEKLKASVKETIIPVRNKVDLSQFTISKKPVSISKLLSIDTGKARVADWVLYAAKTPISISELRGPEIEKLDPSKSSRNRLNTFKEIYTIIYNHIVDPNKPDTLEEWVKTVKFFDIQHIYFAIYKACFEGNNSIPYSCPECSETFMVDTIIDNMIKYKNDQVKEEVTKILKGDTTSTGEYPVELKQISDDYVVAIKDPSVYNIIFETAALDEAFTTKYNDLLGFISYIDAIYYIDRNTGSLCPIGIKHDPNNIVKTTKNKIRVYYEVLSTLTSDQYYELTSYITNIRDEDDNITYVMPEVTCPKCSHVVPEQATGADDLLFTRHRLAAISVM